MVICSMRKFLKFHDGYRYEITPINYQEFMALDLWAGASDSAYESWLRHNNLHELYNYNEESLEESTIEIESSLRNYEFNPNGDDKTWIALQFPVTGKQPLRK
jgi:hypothetical protein